MNLWERYYKEFGWKKVYEKGRRKDFLISLAGIFCSFIFGEEDFVVYWNVYESRWNEIYEWTKEY